MAQSMLSRTYLLLSPAIDPEQRVNLLAGAMIDWACIAPIILVSGMLPYGRYASSTRNNPFYINARLGWVLQELPSFIIPMYYYLTTTKSPSLTATILLSMFTLHYGYRVFIYSFAIRGGKPSPLLFFMLAALFCTCNGYMQTAFLLNYSSYSASSLTSWNFITGSFLFGFGFYTNIRCDRILRSLRKPGETGYKIPRGWLFDFVSGGNYFGEIVEWMGWALACWSAPAFAFAFFAAAFLGSRSYSHHVWYKKHFPDYPKKRKIIIPFIL